MHIFGLHSPGKCWMFKVFLFSILIFHGVFILSLSNKVLGSHSPFRCLDTLQSLFYLFFFLNHFHTLTFRPGFRFSLSVRIFDLHSLSRYWIFFFFNLNFSWGFHPLTLQTGFTFSLSMQMLDFKISILFFSQSGFFMMFHIFYTITLQASCKFSLSMQMFGLHSPSRCFSNLVCHWTKTFLGSSLHLRIDNSGWSMNSSTLFDVAGMRWYQRKYHVLYIIRQPIINSIYWYI